MCKIDNDGPSPVRIVKREHQCELLRLLRLSQPVESKALPHVSLRDDFAFNFGAPVVHNFIENFAARFYGRNLSRP